MKSNHKQIRLEICNCGDCPFHEKAFSETLYNKKIDDCYIYTCSHNKRILHKDWHIPSWCPLESYKEVN